MNPFDGSLISGRLAAGIEFGSGGSGFAPYLLVTASSVPSPYAVWLLGSGLIGIVGIRKKFKK